MACPHQGEWLLFHSNHLNLLYQAALILSGRKEFNSKLPLSTYSKPGIFLSTFHASSYLTLTVWSSPVSDCFLLRVKEVKEFV